MGKEKEWEAIKETPWERRDSIPPSRNSALIFFCLRNSFKVLFFFPRVITEHSLNPHHVCFWTWPPSAVGQPEPLGSFPLLAWLDSSHRSTGHCGRDCRPQWLQTPHPLQTATLPLPDGRCFHLTSGQLKERHNWDSPFKSQPTMEEPESSQVSSTLKLQALLSPPPNDLGYQMLSCGLPSLSTIKAAPHCVFLQPWTVAVATSARGPFLSLKWKSLGVTGSPHWESGIEGGKGSQQQIALLFFYTAHLLFPMASPPHPRLPAGNARWDLFQIQWYEI